MNKEVDNFLDDQYEDEFDHDSSDAAEAIDHNENSSG
jgi:hypothetical protein